MEKFEKVIKGLECCMNSDMSMCLDKCPYHTDGCSGGVKMMRDALSLLKAQEPKKLRCIRRLTKVMKGICPVCEREIESVIHGRSIKFCKYCGQAVKWDD